jgi:hypothetical protein
MAHASSVVLTLSHNTQVARVEGSNNNGVDAATALRLDEIGF